ncbi:MAG: gliding motility protein GldB [Prevotella sp.]|nr:gliding motility protein GldB [Prevotella sp.]
MLLCIGCEWRLKPNDEQKSLRVDVERYDRIQALYLTTGDRAALQQLNTQYPVQTRTLIEDLLKIGHVNDADINSKFLSLYQDSVLRAVIADVERSYDNMDDISDELTDAFEELKDVMPDMELPTVYAQIGTLKESIVVSGNTLGICLDKYLGEDYALYQQVYTESQRRQMVRAMIVPDCLGFYLLSLFPFPDTGETADFRHRHMVKIQWVVNQLLKKDVFTNDAVKSVDTYMHRHRQLTIPQLLESADTSIVVLPENPPVKQ